MFPILNVFADVNGEGRTHHRIDEQSEIFLLFMLLGSLRWWWWWRRLYASRATMGLGSKDYSSFRHPSLKRSLNDDPTVLAFRSIRHGEIIRIWVHVKGGRGGC